MNAEERRAIIKSLPLADIHRHFDGSIRPETLWELSEKYYSAVPGLDFEQFRHYLQWDDSLDNTLLDYLDKFHVPLQYTQFYDNIRRIAYELAEAGKVSLQVFDISGRRVRVLEDRDLPAGFYTVIWDRRDDSGRQASSGIYFYRLTTAGFTATKKMTLVK